MKEKFMFDTLIYEHTQRKTLQDKYNNNGNMASNVRQS